ncbi:hypothetical protein [Thermomonas sp.]|uniref:hypothetical protein n=1 Tax=Thermomonas sp. TaxID=1971895 RepID=UPI00260BAE63|nr:hypothetical protein [Thermomonas sp.]
MRLKRAIGWLCLLVTLGVTAHAAVTGHWVTAALGVLCAAPEAWWLRARRRRPPLVIGG